MIKKLGIFGGGFDPVGLHHMEIAKLAVKTLDITVLMMPCYHHKFDKEPSDAQHRLRMVELACMGRWREDRIAPFDYEIKTKHDGSTWDTLQKLRSGTLNVEYMPIIGTDNAAVIEKWHNWKKLITKYTFVVVGPKTKREIEWFEGHVYIPYEATARSTNIREAAKTGNWDYVKEHTHPDVYDYIQEQGLYQ